jgi:hypothetical protein
MPNPKLRQLLHDFGTTYPVHSREEREAAINQALDAIEAEFERAVGEADDCQIIERHPCDMPGKNKLRREIKARWEGSDHE